MAIAAMNELRRQLYFLKPYSILLTCAVFGFIGYTMTHNVMMASELTVERINIVEKDGTLRMVISNKERQHPGRMNGSDVPKRDRDAGLLFFNDEGDECGGYIFKGNKDEAGMSLSMDQYKNDQVLTLSYDQSHKDSVRARFLGLTLFDRDEFSLSQQANYVDSLKTLNNPAAYQDGMRKFAAAGHVTKRMFVGKTKEGEVGLFLADDKGNPRIQLYINKSNQPVLRMLNEKGEISPNR